MTVLITGAPIGRLVFRDMSAEAVQRAEAKRARKALRRLVEREATRSGRAMVRIGLAVHEYARRRSVPPSLALAMGHPWPTGSNVIPTGGGPTGSTTVPA